MTPLTDHLERYLALRRALGYRLLGHETVLSSFCSYMEEAGETTLTVHVTQGFIEHAGALDASRRLSMVRGFATYLSSFDPGTEVPPRWLAPSSSARVRPYLFTDEQVDALIAATRLLRPALLAETMASLIGLLSAAGLRPGEAYRLDLAHVDLEAGELSVLNSKFGKSRLLPLHETTVVALGSYARARRRSASRTEPAFFLGKSGRRIESDEASLAFRRLLDECAIAAPAGRRPPRLADFRHTFAVDTLVDWHRAGLDVRRQLPVLSAYLGHLVPGNTYWYLESTPELLSAVAGRMSTLFEAER